MWPRRICNGFGFRVLGFEVFEAQNPKPRTLKASSLEPG